MIYIIILVEQILLYQLVGIATSKVLQRYLHPQDRPGLVLTQIMGMAVFSGVQFLAFLLNLPKNHLSMLLLVAVTSGALLALAKACPTREDILPGLILPKRYSDMAFAVVLIPLLLVWIGLALTTGYNMVPKGDGWTWVVKATYWAFEARLDIPGSPYRAYPPTSTLVESLNLLLLGKPEPNCSLLAMWWLHVVFLALVFRTAAKLTNRWGALLLVYLLTLSQDFTFNITLGYRDALLMKVVVAVSLTAVVLTRDPKDRTTALLLGLLVALASTLKDEGLIFSAICLFPLGCALLAQYGVKRIGTLLVDTLPIIIPAVATIAIWWAVRLGCGMKGFQGQTPSPGDIMNGLTAARLQLIAKSMWGSLTTPVFGIALLAVPLAFTKTTPKSILQPLASAVLSLLFITFIYVSTTANVEWHIQTSMSRLMFTPYAFAAMFAVLAGMACFSKTGEE